MLINKISTNNTIKHSLLAGAFLLLVVLGAKVDLDLGGVVSFTLQTLFLGVAYYYLPTTWRLALIFIYLLLGVAGVPVFNGGIGWGYFSSWPLGFFVGFVLAALVPTPKDHSFTLLFRYFIQLHSVILVLGACWVGFYAGSAIKGFDTMLEILPGVFIKSLLGATSIYFVSKYGIKKRA